MRYILIVLLFISFQSWGQLDPLYNQYLFNQGMINPAYNGAYDVFSATLISRVQWAGIEGAPKTNTLNIATSIVDNKVGLGFTVLNDNFGVNNNTEIQLSYSYKLEWRDKVLALGLQTGLLNYSYDYTKVNYEYLDDQLIMGADESATQENFGAGIWLMGDQYAFGFSVPRILDVKIDDGMSESTRYRKHYYVSAAYLFDQLIALKFKPSILLRHVEGTTSIDLNAQFLLNEILWLGASFRNFDSAGLNAQIEINDQFRAGYSFEIPVNTVELGGYGSHEIMVTMDLEIFDFHAKSRKYF